jgi:hypothetical protein
MATVFYIREDSRQGDITSSREVSVEDLKSLYGSAPANYTYMEGVDSPNINMAQGPAKPGSDAAHVVVKIENNEAGGDTFPEQGFYIVKDVKP